MEGEPNREGDRETIPMEEDPQESGKAEEQVETPDRVLLTAGESGESTPEDWQELYKKYLEDSPIGHGTPTGRRGSSRKQPDSSQKRDRVDQQLVLMKKQADNMVATRRKAEDFLRKHTSERPSPTISGDQKPPAEDIIQWVRLMNFDGHLIHPSYLFQVLGATTPSIDATTMAELVMGQYELAKQRHEEQWLRGARQWATMFFPINWIDSHLKSFREGTHLQVRRAQPTPSAGSIATMAKDRRVTVEGQDLPCIRSDAADSSSHTVEERSCVSSGERSPKATIARSRVEESRGRPTSMDKPRRTSRTRVVSGDRRRGGGREDQSRERSPRHHKSSKQVTRQASRRSVPQLSSRRHRSPVRPPSTSQATSSRKRPAGAASESRSMGGASKKPRRSTARQACPARGCSTLTKYLKDHVYEEHLPSLFHQLEPGERVVTNVHRQRLNGLQQLVVGILGPNANIQDMVDHLNSNISVVIRDRITIWGQLQSDMGALCRFAGWHVPKEFVVYPAINSPAALLYWRILLYLLEQLPESDRAEFNQSYGTHRPRGSTSAVSSRESVQDPAHLEVVPRYTESRPVEEQDPQRTRIVSTEGPREHLRISIGVDPHGRDSTQDPVSQRPFAFDSHFHFDRTAKKLLHAEDVSMVTIEEILEYPLPSTPACPVELIGGVMVFCDPETRLSIPLMDGRWKVAVGVHPRKVLQCSDSHLARIRMLLDSNPLVKALGEIGLDRTEPDHMWAEQDRMFKRLLTLSRPDKVLVLHLRGSSNVHSSDVLMAALHHVGRACSTSQKVHLHCFTGTRSDVEDWLERFPNCYFGFTARASTFNHFQLEGLRAVPHDRILVETDSPYMPVDGENRTNTPAYIGDVAQLIARLRGVPLEELLAVTVTNGQQLYQ